MTRNKLVSISEWADINKENLHDRNNREREKNRN